MNVLMLQETLKKNLTIKEEQNQNRNNWFAALLVTAFIFLVVGYCWRYGQEQGNYERGFKEGIKEMSIVMKGEICFE